MALWSPATFDAERGGYRSVTSARMADAEIPLMIIVDKDYSLENEELVAKFMAVYLKAVDTQEDGYRKLVKDYQRFLKTYTEKDYPEDFCLYDLRSHSVFGLEKQLELFESKGHRKSIIHKLERNITSSLVLFLNDSSSEDACAVHKVRSPRNITDKYLKLAEPYLRQLND